MRVSHFGLITLVLAASVTAQQVSEPGAIQRVLLVDGTRSVPLKDNLPSSKGSWMVVVSKKYYVFRGPKAALRTKTTMPEFLFETDTPLDDPVDLFRFDVRSNRREIRVARGSGGLVQMSIPKDHLIETTMEEIGNGPTRRYRLKPKRPLQPGEYCLSRGISSFYDFGVD